MWNFNARNDFNVSDYPGAELEEFRRKEREKNGLLNQKSNQLADESSDESEAEDVKRGNKPVRHDIVVRSSDGNNKNAGQGGPVQHGFFKSTKKNPIMFPYFEDKVKFDEYG